MATEHTVLFSADTVAEKVDELAARIDRDHGDDGVLVIGLDWDEHYRDLPFIALANP